MFLLCIAALLSGMLCHSVMPVAMKDHAHFITASLTLDVINLKKQHQADCEGEAKMAA